MAVMEEIARAVLAALAGGEPVVIASVIASALDSPQPGAKLLIHADGRLTGALGGGEIEETVVRIGLAAIARHAVETIRLDESGGLLSDRHSEAAVEVLLEVVEAPARLLIVGGGHIGRSISRIGTEAGFVCTVLDDRPDYANRERFPEAESVICGDFEASLAALPVGPNMSIVLVTRGHKQDELSMRALVNRGAGYLGMIGSKRRTGAVLEHLASEGVSQEALDRVHTPIGLDIGAETPEEIAVSIIAELIMVRRGGTGGSMYHRQSGNHRAAQVD